jgi:hypothetical protein
MLADAGSHYHNAFDTAQIEGAIANDQFSFVDVDFCFK